MEMGQWFESSEILVSTEPELFEMNRHVVAGKRFRGKIVIDGSPA